MAKSKGKIVVDSERCKGCHVCIPSCPQKVIAPSSTFNSKGYNNVEPVNNDLCTGCTNCATICPDGAITVYRLQKES